MIDDAPRQSFVFSEVVTARYVEFTCDDNFYAYGGSGPPGGGDRVGLGEVAFADAVPNPHPILVVQAALDFGNVGALVTNQPQTYTSRVQHDAARFPNSTPVHNYVTLVSI